MQTTQLRKQRKTRKTRKSRKLRKYDVGNPIIEWIEKIRKFEVVGFSIRCLRGFQTQITQTTQLLSKLKKRANSKLRDLSLRFFFVFAEFAEVAYFAAFAWFT